MLRFTSPQPVEDKPAAGHTPGPWERGTNAESGKGFAICAGYRVLAVVRGTGYPMGTGWSPGSDADANLMAAAPCLLAALAALIEPFAKMSNDELNSADIITPSTLKSILAARAAIAQATGGEA